MTEENLYRSPDFFEDHHPEFEILDAPRISPLNGLNEVRRIS